MIGNDYGLSHYWASFWCFQGSSLYNSSLYHKGNNGTLFPESKREIGGVEVPVVVLGDPAYPLLPWMMKPYCDTGNLTRDQQRFNYRLSRARVVVEDAYGQLGKVAMFVKEERY